METGHVNIPQMTTITNVEWLVSYTRQGPTQTQGVSGAIQTSGGCSNTEPSSDRRSSIDDRGIIREHLGIWQSHGKK